jgi:hypothetical protein
MLVTATFLRLAKNSTGWRRARVLKRLKDTQSCPALSLAGREVARSLTGFKSEPAYPCGWLLHFLTIKNSPPFFCKSLSFRFFRPKRVFLMPMDQKI